jgi:serine/threonine-protein kinase
MEYVEGATLGQLLVHAADEHQRLPIKVGLRVALDMLAGLHAAHELKDDDGAPLGIVHRDVSPQNVLVGVDGSARLSDFGVARATSKLSTTGGGRLKGKLAYMAPEQAQGSGEIDRRADVFAAGVVLWEVLTCRRLFKGDGEADTLDKLLQMPVPPVRTATPTVPAALEAVVMKALQRDREKRFGSAAELGEALESACRVLGALGSSRDVALHVDDVIGVDLKQQRDALRAWLARNEARPADSTRRPTDEERSSSLPPSARAGGLPSIPSAVISNRPPGVTSVPPPSLPVPAKEDRPPGRRRSFSWAWALPAVAAIAVALSLGARGRSAREPEGRAFLPSGATAAMPGGALPSASSWGVPPAASVAGLAPEVSSGTSTAAGFDSSSTQPVVSDAALVDPDLTAPDDPARRPYR